MESKNKVFPHRLSLGKNNIKCDICGCDSNINFIKVNQFMGFCYCSNNCKELLNSVMKQTTKSIDELEKRYGKTFKVKRSHPNNNLEDGWSVNGIAFQEQEGGPFWVEVRNNAKAKHVQLLEIDSWNNLTT
jgi:hypothetical protein